MIVEPFWGGASESFFERDTLGQKHEAVREPALLAAQGKDSCRKECIMHATARIMALRVGRTPLQGGEQRE